MNVLGFFQVFNSFFTVSIIFIFCALLTLAETLICSGSLDWAVNKAAMLWNFASATLSFNSSSIQRYTVKGLKCSFWFILFGFQQYLINIIEIKQLLCCILIFYSASFIFLYFYSSQVPARKPSFIRLNRVNRKTPEFEFESLKDRQHVFEGTHDPLAMVTFHISAASAAPPNSLIKL